MTSILGNRIIFVLSLAGAGVATYITLAHLHFVDLGCSAVHGCEEVARHFTAKGFGIPGLQAIPTAAFGLAMYLVLAGISLKRAAAIEQYEEQRKLGLYQWGITGLGVLVTAWLTYLEAFVIHAWCQWCLASAAIITLIFLTACAERLKVPPPPLEGEAA